MNKIIEILWNHGFCIWDLTILAIALFAAFSAYAIWQLGYFKRRGVKYCENIYPIVGHMGGMMMMKENLIDLFLRTYKAFPKEKYVGHMQMVTPMIVLRDLDLIKQVTIKEFDHFLNHLVTINEDGDSLLGNNLFAMRGEKWRDMRATLSPAFTSSKMRGMFNFISETGEQMVSYYLNKMQERQHRERGLVEIEMKDTYTRYASDVIATSAFGIKVDSLENPNNEFYIMGKRITDFSGFMMVKFFLFSAFPKLMRRIGFTFLEPKVRNFFYGLFMTTLKEREEKRIVRPDMIHLLQLAQKGTLKHETDHESKDTGFATVEESQVGLRMVKRNWSDDEIVAQALLFFIAGFETASTLLSFVSHELATNPEVQEKLYREIEDVIKENGKKLEYNNLIKMTYMDMVVSESLRKWPPAAATDRVCIKPFKLPPTSENDGYTLKAGQGVWIPIYGIHHDPQYFPNPEKFDPERFSEANKEKIHPMSFIPFGSGPRNCIGSRFALMEIKAVLFHLLASFKFVPTAKTQHTIEIDKNTFNLRSSKGFWLGLEARN